jgi:hypothetical protein
MQINETGCKMDVQTGKGDIQIDLVVKTEEVKK